MVRPQVYKIILYLATKNILVYIILIISFSNKVRTIEINSYVRELDLQHTDLKMGIQIKPIIIGMDLCGTLINSKERDIRAINKTIHKFLGQNLEWKDIKPLKQPELSMKENFPNFFQQNAAVAYRFYLNAMFEEIENVNIFDGVFEFLEFCKQNNIKTAIITNRDSEYIEQFRIKNKDGQRLFSSVDTIVTANKSKSTKPNPEILQFALNIHGINPINYNSVFFIGNALADLKKLMEILF